MYAIHDSVTGQQDEFIDWSNGASSPKDQRETIPGPHGETYPVPHSGERVLIRGDIASRQSLTWNQTQFIVESFDPETVSCRIHHPETGETAKRDVFELHLVGYNYDPSFFGENPATGTANHTNVREEAALCECVHVCAEDPQSAFSLSGEWHVHPEWPCSVHPDAQGDRLSREEDHHGFTSSSAEQ